MIPPSVPFNPIIIPKYLPVVLPFVEGRPYDAIDEVIRRGIFWSTNDRDGQGMFGWPSPRDLDFDTPNVDKAVRDSIEYVIASAWNQHLSRPQKQQLKLAWEQKFGIEWDNFYYRKLMGEPTEFNPNLDMWNSVDVTDDDWRIFGTALDTTIEEEMRPLRGRLPVAFARPVYGMSDRNGNPVEPIGFHPSWSRHTLALPPGVYFKYMSHRDDPHRVNWTVYTVVKCVAFHVDVILSAGTSLLMKDYYDRMNDSLLRPWLKPGVASPYQLWLWSSVMGGGRWMNPKTGELFPILME